MAPFAVTPDELGTAWKNARVVAKLRVRRNEEAFGVVLSDEMEFGFDELVAHAAYSRSLCAGTIIGSGTVSSRAYKQAGSCCIAERRAIETIEHGTPSTGFLRFGERVRMDIIDHPAGSVFGEINQKVVKAEDEGE
jgi:fumarylacetoacetate (FAA) hydrolase